MLRWFHALMPKEERFFELFARHSHAVLAGAQTLRAMMEGGEAVSTNCKTVMDREHDADNVTREVLIAVRRTFITPFDRGSISDLITAMDNSIDQMQTTAKTVILFDIDSFTPQMKEMGDVIVKSAQLLQEAIPLLSAISSHAVKISDLTAQIRDLRGVLTNFTMSGCGSFIKANQNLIRWGSSSETKSMIISKRSSTASMT